MKNLIDNRLPIPDNAVKPPSRPYVKFLRFEWILVSEFKKIVDRTKNVRVADISHTNVTKWKKALEKFTYRHFAFFPPVIDVTVNRPISGHHKYEAHRLTRQEYIFVAFVETDSVSNSEIYASICNKPNDEEYINEPRTAADIISDVKKELARQNFNKDYPPTENKINEILKRLEVDNSEVNKSHVVREVKKDLEVTESLSTYSIEEAKEYVETEFGDSVIQKGPKENVTVKTYTNDKVTPWKDDIEWFINSHLQRYEQKNSKLPIKRYASFQDVKDVQVARDNKDKSLETIKDNILKVASIILDDNYKMPKFIYLPQKDSDE